MDEARKACATVAVTIFVNPLQFDRPDDLARYPRTLEADVDLCGTHGVDVIFAPAPAELYPQPPMCTVRVGMLADHLCGRFRPGHFEGVATVVMKLFQIVGAERAYFGQKDGQQLAIVKRLVRDMNVPIDVVGVPTVREQDGLALSSRNVHLSASQRAIAPALYRMLSEARALVAAGQTDAEAIKAEARRGFLNAADVSIEYLEIVDLENVQPVAAITGPVMIAAAIWVGKTRLIDNVLWNPVG